MTRYPLEPLMALTRHPEGRRLSLNEVAALAGLHFSTVQKYKASGMSLAQAERLAEACGFLPYEVWPEILDAAVASVEKVCAHDVCDNVFVCAPHGAHRKYCSDRCRWSANNMKPTARKRRAAWVRNRYQTDPEFRERRLAYKRKWYWENPEAACAAERSAYQRRRDQEKQADPIADADDTHVDDARHVQESPRSDGTVAA